MCHIGVTERKIENLKKEGKMRISVAEKTDEKCPRCVIKE